MPLSKNCAHKNCEHPVHPCRNCSATVMQCKASQHNGNGWCCDSCMHVRVKETAA